MDFFISLFLVYWINLSWGECPCGKDYNSEKTFYHMFLYVLALSAGNNLILKIWSVKPVTLGYVLVMVSLM